MDQEAWTSFLLLGCRVWRL